MPHRRPACSKMSSASIAVRKSEMPLNRKRKMSPDLSHLAPHAKSPLLSRHVPSSSYSQAGTSAQRSATPLPTSEASYSLRTRRSPSMRRYNSMPESGMRQFANSNQYNHQPDIRSDTSSSRYHAPASHPAIIPNRQQINGQLVPPQSLQIANAYLAFPICLPTVSQHVGNMMPTLISCCTLHLPGCPVPGCGLHVPPPSLPQPVHIHRHPQQQLQTQPMFTTLQQRSSHITGLSVQVPFHYGQHDHPALLHPSSHQFLQQSSQAMTFLPAVPSISHMSGVLQRVSEMSHAQPAVASQPNLSRVQTSGLPHNTFRSAQQNPDTTHRRASTTDDLRQLAMEDSSLYRLGSDFNGEFYDTISRRLTVRHEQQINEERRQRATVFPPARLASNPTFLQDFLSMLEDTLDMAHTDVNQTNQPANNYQNYEALLGLARQLGETKPKGLTRSEISRIPWHHYVLPSDGEESDDQTNCVVCMSEFERRERIRVLPCKHNFHRQCVDKWLKTNNTCPMCRADVSKLLKADLTAAVTA